MKKGKILPVLLEPKQREELERAAKRAGVPHLSTWIRTVALKEARKTAP